MYLLAGDIGGTKTLLQLSEYSGADYRVLKEISYPSGDYTNFDSLLCDFLEDCEVDIEAACFGVAGPVYTVEGGTQQAQVTNLPWALDRTQLRDRFDIENINLINDFQSIGYGLTALSSNDLICLQQGEPKPHGNLMVIGAGTGLGVAQLVWNGKYYDVLATEGGHSNVAPSSDLELELSRYLLKHFGYNSLELVLSGPGLANIYRFLALHHNAQLSEEYKTIMNNLDQAASVTRHAEIAPDSIARQALEMFVHLYGSHVGDFCLTTLPHGGAYIAGGIAAKILTFIKEGSFMKAFANKGKMSNLMASFPLHVVTNPKVGLLGSREYARYSVPS